MLTSPTQEECNLIELSMSSKKFNKIIRLSTPLKRLMEETRLKPSQLAEMAGVQRSNISNYLHDAANASIPVLLHFAELARSQELREIFYALAGKSPDLGRNLFSFKLESYQPGATHRGIADTRQTYSLEKSHRQESEEHLKEVITVPCVPSSFISAPSSQIQSLDLKWGFLMNFEKDRLFKIDPLGIWVCTRMPVSDDSMINTIHPDELLLVNKRFSLRSKSIGGKIFLVRLDRKVTARRLIMEKDLAVLVADNHHYPSRFIKEMSELKKLVIGHVIWKGGEIK